MSEPKTLYLQITNILQYNAFVKNTLSLLTRFYSLACFYIYKKNVKNCLCWQIISFTSNLKRYIFLSLTRCINGEERSIHRAIHTGNYCSLDKQRGEKAK